jgi:hypothetical protein
MQLKEMWEEALGNIRKARDGIARIYNKTRQADSKLRIIFGQTSPCYFEGE